MVQRAAAAGFNTLIVQVRGRGDAYYESRWEPRSEAILRRGEGFDPLALVIQEAKARGLGVHAWVNAHLVGGIGVLPADPLHLIQARPDLLAVPRDLALELYNVNPRSFRFTEALLDYARANQDRIEGIYSSPSHPEVKEHIYSVWMDLAESYELDGLHFDYIRYPSPDFDYSKHALEQFRAWVTSRISSAQRQQVEAAFSYNPLAYPEALPGPWDEFRRTQITELVERVYHGVKMRHPEIVVSAAVFANAEDAYRSRFQDWPPLVGRRDRGCRGAHGLHTGQRSLPGADPLRHRCCGRPAGLGRNRSVSQHVPGHLGQDPDCPGPGSQWGGSLLLRLGGCRGRAGRRQILPRSCRREDVPRPLSSTRGRPFQAGTVAFVMRLAPLSGQAPSLTSPGQALVSAPPTPPVGCTFAPRSRRKRKRINPPPNRATPVGRPYAVPMSPNTMPTTATKRA